MISQMETLFQNDYQSTVKINWKREQKTQSGKTKEKVKI